MFYWLVKMKRLEVIKYQRKQVVRNHKQIAVPRVSHRKILRLALIVYLKVKGERDLWQLIMLKSIVQK